MANLARNLVATAATHPERPAVRLDGMTLTYAQLGDLAARAAAYLRVLGVRPGDRVGLMLPNELSFPVLYYGILRAGAVVVPMNPLLRGREVEHLVNDSGMTVLLVHAGIVEAGADGRVGGARVVVLRASDQLLLDDVATFEPAPMVERDETETAVILYTSGTTGVPKGAELTHRNLDLNCRASNELAGLGPDDVVMGCLPLFHAFGQSVSMNASIAAGALLTLVPRFAPEVVLDVVVRDRVTVFHGVPTMYVAMLGCGPGGRDISSLRLCISGGASLPGEVLRGFRDAFGAQILEGYGLSETSPAATFNRAEAARVGSIGTPIPGVELDLVGENGAVVPDGEVGEIVIRGHNVMKGYWGRPDETAAAIRDGWFHTGDLGRRDAEGFYYVVDRLKELIIRGGFNVYPREIEEVLYEHPDVLEAAVVGVPHPTLGEEVAAVVVLKPGATVAEPEVREYVRERVAPYKYPRTVHFVAELPKGATGKILKRELEIPVGAEGR